MLEAQIFEEIYSLDKYHNLVSLREDRQRNTVKLNISRDREVNVATKDIVDLKENLVAFFYNPDEDVYEPRVITSGDIYWSRIKGRVLNGVDIHIPKTSIIHPIVDKRNPKYKEAIALLFGADVDPDNYDFKLSGVRQGTIRTERTDLTSLNVERAIPLPEPLTRLTEDERYDYNQRDRFLAIIYRTGDSLILVDIGELIDTGDINFRDLEDLFSSNTNLEMNNKKFVNTAPVIEMQQSFTRNNDGSKRPVDKAKLVQFLAETLSNENGKDVIITGTNAIHKPWKEMSPTERVTSVKEQFSTFSELADGSFAVVYAVLGVTHLIVSIDLTLPTSMQDSWVYSNYDDAMTDLNSLETHDDEPRHYDSFCPALDLEMFKAKPR